MVQNIVLYSTGMKGEGSEVQIVILLLRQLGTKLVVQNINLRSTGMKGEGSEVQIAILLLGQLGTT